MPTRDAQFRRILAATITAGWVISFILDAVITDYNPPSGLHALMLAVAGWAFGGPVVQAARGKESDE